MKVESSNQPQQNHILKNSNSVETNLHLNVICVIPIVTAIFEDRWQSKRLQSYENTENMFKMFVYPQIYTIEFTVFVSAFHFTFSLVFIFSLKLRIVWVWVPFSPLVTISTIIINVNVNVTHTHIYTNMQNSIHIYHGPPAPATTIRCWWWDEI